MGLIQVDTAQKGEGLLMGSGFLVFRVLLFKEGPVGIHFLKWVLTQKGT